MVMVLDTVRPNMASYRLLCVNTDAGLPGVVKNSRRPNRWTNLDRV